MIKIAVFGATGYLGSLIKNDNYIKKKYKFNFFSRNKKLKNYVNYLSLSKYSNLFKNYDLVIHFVGPNQDQLKRDKNLSIKKKIITKNICDLCLKNSLKLIYLSSLQVYTDYGKKNLQIKSKLNINNSYSRSHLESENIIFSKFRKQKNMFMILRMGNVFGFTKFKKKRKISDNLIHSLCYSAIKKKKIIIHNGSVQRNFIPSKIFLNVIESIIEKKYFKNSIVNIIYKNYTLKKICQIIQKRVRSIYNINIDTLIKNYVPNKNFKIYTNKYFRLNFTSKIFNSEIDQILKIFKDY